MYTDFPLYPTSIFSNTDYPAQADNTDTVYAALINALKTEMQACFDELGILPKGSHATVKARIEALELQLKITIDLMEYATDAAAQLAYISSASGVIKYNQETSDDAPVALGDENNVDNYRATIINVTAATWCSAVSILLNVRIGSPTGDLTFRIETDDSNKPSGTLAHANATKTIANASITDSAWNKVDFTPFSLSIGTYWLVCYIPDQATNVRLIWARYNGGTGAYSPDKGANWTTESYAPFFRLYDTSLVCSSDNTIPEQGTYCLKVIAQITSSLSETLTRTVSPVKDLTGKTSITLWARSDRTGSNFKVEYRDSGGNTISHTVDIDTVDTWEEQEIDISAVTDANKDAINQIKYTILNADAAAEFYLDNNIVP